MKKIKTYLFVLIALMVIGAGIYGYIYVNDLKNQVSHWKNEFAKEQGLVELKDGLFEQQALILEGIEIENDKLRKRADETGRTINGLVQMNLEYEVRIIGLLETQAVGDTTLVDVDTSQYVPRMEDRQFKTTFNEEIELAGIFQIKPPFNIYISYVKLHIKLDMTLSQSDDETWWLDIDTNSEFLKPEDVRVEIVPLPDKWRFFVSSNVYLQGFTLDLHGLDFRGGVTRGNWGISGGILISDGIYPNIGVIKYF